MKTNQLAPYARIDKSTIQFFLNGYIYEKKGDTLNIVETIASPSLKAAIKMYEKFEIADHQITWYNGKSKFIYKIYENKFMWNNTQILDESFVNHVKAAGAISFKDLEIAQLFESVPTLLNNFMILENCATFESQDRRVRLDVFIIENKMYVTRYNNQTKLIKFFEEKNANNLVDYINEQTGENALVFLKSYLEDEMKEQAVIESKISTLQEMLAYLNDKREELNSNDNGYLPEVIKADNILKEEINNIKLEINNLQNQ